MGQVFTWGDVRLGRIPKMDDFKLVAEKIKATLSQEESVVAALLFGSVVRGDFNIRSDLDCLVIYETDKEWAVAEVIYKLDSEARALHVPINFTPSDTALAKTRLHHLGVTFLKHLESSIEAGGTIKGNLQDLCVLRFSPKEEVEWYIRTKMYNLQESYLGMATFSEERIHSFLKKAYEAPIHVARKMLVYIGAPFCDSKAEVVRLYREKMPQELYKKLSFVRYIDDYYTKELETQLEKPNADTYAWEIGRLKTETPAVLEFLRANILWIDSNS